MGKMHAFSVKSRYYLILSLTQLAGAVMENHDCLQALWQSAIPTKVGVIGWRLFLNEFPVSWYLVRWVILCLLVLCVLLRMKMFYTFSSIVIFLFQFRMGLMYGWGWMVMLRRWEVHTTSSTTP